MKTRAARIHAFGKPAEVLSIDEIELPPLRPHELRVRMLAASINPADLNIIEGTYGYKPELPAVIGNEGMGEVVEIDSNCRGFALGDKVAAFKIGAWSEIRNASSDEVVQLPADIGHAQAAMITVNPPTAHGMLTGFRDLQPGDWVAQNAANSGVGRWVIAIARELGLRTLNVVRRPELIDELKTQGADAVVLEDCNLRKEAKELCGGSLPKLGLNAVGGASALNIANALAEGSPHITYGAMSRQPVKVPNGLLIFKGLIFRGFWLRQWFAATPAEDRNRVFGLVSRMITGGKVAIPIAQKFPLSQIHEALAASAHENRGGKIILDLKNDT